MRTVRVLLAEMPRMLADILSAVFVSQSDFELVGHVIGVAELALAASKAAADVLVLGRRLQRREALRVLCRCPQMKIITIDADGHSGASYGLRLDRAVLDDVSPAALVAAIRGTTGKSDRRPGR